MTIKELNPSESLIWAASSKFSKATSLRALINVL